MKITGIVTVVCIVLALLLSPFARTDVAELLPVQTLCLRQEGEWCQLVTDGGLLGQGTGPEDALADLQRTAPGKVIFSTTRQLVVEESGEKYLKPLLDQEALRPGTEVYRSQQPIDPADAALWLNRHGVNTTVSRLQAAWLTGEAISLPLLTGGEGRYEVIE